MRAATSSRQAPPLPQDVPTCRILSRAALSIILSLSSPTLCVSASAKAHAASLMTRKSKVSEAPCLPGGVAALPRARNAPEGMVLAYRAELAVKLWISTPPRIHPGEKSRTTPRRCMMLVLNSAQPPPPTGALPAVGVAATPGMQRTRSTIQLMPQVILLQYAARPGSSPPPIQDSPSC